MNTHDNGRRDGGRRVGGVIRTAALAALALLLSGPAVAHDIWLHAEPFVVARGGTLIVRQLVGTELDTETSRSEETIELPVLRDMTPRFELITASGSVDLMAELPPPEARPEVKPVLARRMEASGYALVVMDHDVLYTGHTDDEFLEYLGHEGLALDDYRPLMGSDGFQDEGYVRTLKALVKVGDPIAGEPAESDPGLHAHVTGQAIELLLLQNPYALEPGDPLEVEVRLHGEPLAGVLVKAINADGSSAVTSQTVRSDAAGRVRFSLARPGLWLVRTVLLARCTERSAIDCADTEWESYWTAFSFAVD